MSNRTTRKILLAASALIVAAGVVIVADQSGGSAGAATPAALERAVPVGVSVMTEQPVRIWAEFSGRLKAVDFAEIKPEAGGRIMEVRFRDGQLVTAGDILFVIDPSSYQVAVAKAEANLASATTNAAFARSEFERAGSLIRTNAISKSGYDSRGNTERVAWATVEAAAAELRQARLDLDHTLVRAPITGRVSRAEITVGNLVETGPGAPVLTSITSNQGIYADFEIDEQTYLREIRSQDQAQVVPVELTVRGDETHVHHGQIHSFDNRIDTASGTIRARAVFANEGDTLVPGMTVTLRVASGDERPVLLVPQAAISSDQNKKFVYVIGDDNRAAYREVVFGKPIGDKRIVLTGLAAGERVIIKGLQHVRPASLVAALEIDNTVVAAVPASRR